MTNEARVGRPRASRAWQWAAIISLALLAFVSIGWAATTLLVRPAVDVKSEKYSYVVVVDGEVGAAIRLNVAAEWVIAPLANNQAIGTITSVPIESGQSVDAGSVLYGVNLRPVVIAEGAIPSFRTLTRGTSGTDVAQLQTFLSAKGLYTGSADGLFGPQTAQALRDWQKQIGIPADGVVLPGDFVYVPTLPIRVALDEKTAYVGATLSGGERMILSLPATPSFALQVNSSQSLQMPSGTAVEISASNGEIWEALVGERTTRSDGMVVITLESAHDGPICASSCETVPITGVSLLSSKIVTVTPVSGPVVPTAALRSGPDGGVEVVTDSGDIIKIEVLASANGAAVIAGDRVVTGLRLRVPAVS